MKLAGVGDEAVREKTGKGWAEWLDLLDRRGAADLNHTQTAKMLREEHGVSAWWAQKITGGYEQARKGRQVHEMPEGFSISRTRTWPYPKSAVIRAWLDDDARRKWLPEQVTDVRETTQGESVWMEWPEGDMRVNVRLTDKGPSKTSLTVEHSRIPTSDQVERFKGLWKDRLAALRRMLDSQGEGESRR